MSAAGRGAERRAADYYPTPAWCVRRLLEVVDLPAGRWLEPTAGDGAIVRAVREAGGRAVEWTAYELREECRAPLEATGATVRIGDFLAGAIEPHAVAILNPPFSRALEVVRRCVESADYVAALLRLNWLEGAERHAWLRVHVPDVYVLPNRPSFTGTGTDATAYGWFLWSFGGVATRGRVSLLAQTPAAERRR